MKNHFATYNQSLALKEELGFNEPCFGWYHPNGYIIYAITKDKDSIVNAPLKSQVFEFFRGYKLTVVIEDYLDDYEVKIVEWTLSDDRITHEFPNRFDSWGDAESAAIDKLIEIVKMK